MRFFFVSVVFFLVEKENRGQNGNSARMGIRQQTQEGGSSLFSGSEDMSLLITEWFAKSVIHVFMRCLSQIAPSSIAATRISIAAKIAIAAGGTSKSPKARLTPSNTAVAVTMANIAIKEYC